MTIKRIATIVFLLLFLVSFYWMFRREVVDVATYVPRFIREEIVADTPALLAHESLPSTWETLPVATTVAELDTDNTYITGVLAEYRAGKGNIFFDEMQFIGDTLKSKPDIIQQLNFMLLDSQDLMHTEELPDIFNHPPEILKQRMAAIDMLETLASSEYVNTTIAAQAVDALLSIVQCPLPPHTSPTGKRLLLAERHDAFTALVRVNPYLALNLLEQFNNKKYQSMLAQAAMLGLVDLGVSRTDAMNMTSFFNTDIN